MHMSFFGAIVNLFLFETQWKPHSFRSSRHLGQYASHEPSASIKNRSRTSAVNFRNFFHEILPCPTFSKWQKRNYLLMVEIALSRIINRLFSYREFGYHWYMKLNNPLSEPFKKRYNSRRTYKIPALLERSSQDSFKNNALYCKSCKSTFKDLKRHVFHLNWGIRIKQINSLPVL